MTHWYTPAKRGEEAVGYQGREASETTNTLFLADNSGQMLTCSTSQEGLHGTVPPMAFITSKNFLRNFAKC